jgi:hypothetical protein
LERPFESVCGAWECRFSPNRKMRFIVSYFLERKEPKLEFIPSGIFSIWSYPVQCIIPDYAVAEFAEDARRRVRRRTLVLQVPDNKANSVKSATPCGFKCRKNISKNSFTFWVKDLNTFVKYNRPILKIKFPFSVFEVHNSG